MKASLKNYRQAPRKTRLVADLVRGKKVSRALTLLTHLEKRAAEPFAKLIKSAIANAKVLGASEEELTVKKVTVDKGYTFSRYRARARGRAGKIDKHTSHIAVELEAKK